MANPLVAETKDSTKAYSGVSLLESAADLKSAIESGDWASVAMGGPQAGPSAPPAAGPSGSKPVHSPEDSRPSKRPRQGSDVDMDD
ncbi:hypothetical protein [Amycolatopsis sp. cmx-8-4]|uniref:hypothetical protein n=1 Tax=Amycolatopsis sp. cmx-8-4 TaxID=2790947 RepID=UPI00397D0641